jgi:hypothetical protein
LHESCKQHHIRIDIPYLEKRTLRDRYSKLYIISAGSHFTLRACSQASIITTAWRQRNSKHFLIWWLINFLQIYFIFARIFARFCKFQKLSQKERAKESAKRREPTWHVVKYELDWTGLDRTGLDWTGPGKRGLNPCFTNRELNL